MRMLKKLFIIILLILLPIYASAFDKWSNKDYLLEGIFLTLHAIDYGQTLNLASHPDKWSEGNPILGKHPSKGSVHIFMLSTAIIHIGAIHVLPKQYRPYIQCGSIAIKGFIVGHNFNLGVGVKF
jgi:hypothetical protein